MPPRQTAFFRTRSAIVAAAVTIAKKTITRPKLEKKDGAWQKEVWELYDQVGELHFGLRWKGQACSRLRLVAAHSGDEPEPIAISDDPEAPSPAPDVKAVAIAESFANGAHNRSKMLRAAAIHIDAIGETFVVISALDGCVSVYAPSDVKVEGTGENQKWTCGGVETSPDDLILHVRVAHPGDSTRVDSPIKAALPVLRELHGLNQQLLGAIDSRLAGAGLLVVPQSVSPPVKPPTTDDDSTTPEGDPEQDPFLVALIEAMMTPIADRESAAAVVPLVVRVPDEVVSKIQHIVFAQPFDPELRALREEAVRRLAIDMDEPPEILLGTGDVNHWGQWAIDENAIKFNIIPTAQTIIDVIIEEWYRPALHDAGILNVEDYTLMVDAGELEQRADKSTNAVALYDRGVITRGATVRESGFEPGDLTEALPDVASQMAMELVGRVPALFHEPGLPALVEQLRIVMAGGDTTAYAPVPPSEQIPAKDQPAVPLPPVEDAPVDQTRALPPAPGAGLLSPEQRMHSLLDASQVAVMRALELAGKRFTTIDREHRGATLEPLHRMHVAYTMPEEKFDFLLKGAWTALSTVASPCIVEAVEDYTRELIKAGVPHERELLATVLARAAQAGCDAAA